MTRPRKLWDGQRAPVTLLGGYLGSGKTTLLNELLAHADRRYAVLVNDIGSVNVDAALISRRAGDMLELSDGCVCCSLSDGFAQAFERLRERPEPPDHVIVELSGVADPARVVPHTGTAGFRIDGVLVLFDADQGLERERDRWCGDSVRRQVEAADLLVLTKCDLVDDAREAGVRAKLAELSPGVPVIRAEHGRLPAGWLAPAPRRRAPARESAADPQVFSIHLEAVVECAQLENWLAQLPASVLRAKGLVRGATGLLLVDAVGRRRAVRRAPSDLDAADVVGTIVLIATPDLDPQTLPLLAGATRAT